MYTKITLEKFERNEFCYMRESEFNCIREELKRGVSVLNNGIAEGYDYHEYYLQSCENRLVGMARICNIIGLDVMIHKELIEN